MGLKFVCVAAVVALGLAGMAQASVIVSIEEGADDVVVSYSGTINTDDLGTGKTNDRPVQSIRAGKSILNITDGYLMFRDDIASVDRGWGPSPFPDVTAATSGFGDVFGFTNTKLFVPEGYDGGTLSGSLTFAGASLDSLSLNPGSFTATTWGSGDSADSIFVDVFGYEPPEVLSFANPDPQSTTGQNTRVAAAPVPASLPLLLVGGLAFVALRRRGRS